MGAAILAEGVWLLLTLTCAIAEAPDCRHSAATRGDKRLEALARLSQLSGALKNAAPSQGSPTQKSHGPAEAGQEESLDTAGLTGPAVAAPPAPQAAQLPLPLPLCSHWKVSPSPSVRLASGSWDSVCDPDHGNIPSFALQLSQFSLSPLLPLCFRPVFPLLWSDQIQLVSGWVLVYLYLLQGYELIPSRPHPADRVGAG